MPEILYANAGGSKDAAAPEEKARPQVDLFADVGGGSYDASGLPNQAALELV